MHRIRFALFIGLGFAVLGLIIPLVVFMTESPAMTEGANTFEDWLPLGIIVFVGVVISAALIPVFRILLPGKIKNGVVAEAEVVEIGDTGVSINDNPQVRLMLEVRPPSGAVFMAEVKTIVSRLQVGQVVPGTRVQVVYDPNDLKRIQVMQIDYKASPATGVEARLGELNRLREKGLVTAEEYQRKRQEILKDL